MQKIADELRCSVMQAAAIKPEYREMALTKLVAEKRAVERNEQATAK